MNEFNKQLILDLYSRVFGQQDEKFAESIIAEHYIQHNPMVATGKDGFMKFLSFLKQLPVPENPAKPFKRIISEDNFVAIHSKIEHLGKQNAVVEIYRIEDEKIAEHWDAVQEIINSEPEVGGAVDFDENESTVVNKKIIIDFIKTVFVENQIDKVQTLLTPSISVERFWKKMEYFKLHRIVGEKNFVVTQSEFRSENNSFVKYDVFRLSKGIIVNYWTVQQIIPEKMMHTNGMI